MTRFDRPTFLLMAWVSAALAVATVIALVWRATAKDDARRRAADSLLTRVRSWWLIVIVFVLALWIGRGGVTVLFALISFHALRELITLAPTRGADHHTLFWTFFVMLPLQYWLVHLGWYGLYSILIPVYGFLFLAIRSTLTGDHKRYLERTAKIHWGAMICIYCISHVPALLMLHLNDSPVPAWKLVVYLLTVVQSADVLATVVGRTIGRRPMVRKISKEKTWEGVIAGLVGATIIGVGLRSFTPFTWHAALWMSFAVVALGFLGSIVMSSIKRDAGVKDWSDLIAGHGGMLDRVGSLAFAAPVFFHVTRYFHTGG